MGYVGGFQFDISQFIGRNVCLKRIIHFIIVLICIWGLIGCNKKTVEDVQTINNTVTVSGSFIVSVREVIPDYCLDNITPNVAIVTEFQSYPFTLHVGEKIARQLNAGETYVFTIEPIVVECSKEYLKKLNLSSLVWELPDFEITDFRLATEDECGDNGVCLSIE